MQYAIESDIQFFNQSKVLVLGKFDDSEQNPIYNAYNEKHPETMQKLRQLIVKKNQWITHLGEDDQYILLINHGENLQNSPMANYLNACKRYAAILIKITWKTPP